MSKLKERFRRLKESAFELAYAGYSLRVRSQQTKNPRHPKRDITIPTNHYPRDYAASILAEVINEAYSFTGIIRLPNSQIFYEFVNTTIKAYSDFTDYRFLYIPVTPATTKQLKGKLPSLTTWDLKAQTIQVWSPMAIAIVDSSADRWPDFYSLEVEDCYHPYLPDFYFTGRVVNQRNSKVLYEYFDSAGLYGVQDGIYMSVLRPVNLDFPLGVPSDLVMDDCLKELIGCGPTSGHLDQVGQFTGYVTTAAYHPKVTFHLYEREDGTGFLSESLPHPKANAYIEQAYLISKIKRPGIKLTSSEGNQTLGLTQTTTPSETLILN